MTTSVPSSVSRTPFRGYAALDTRTSTDMNLAGKELGWIDKDGYLCVPYCSVSARAEFYAAAHTLIAKSIYRMPWPKGGIVHHRDGDKGNNHYTNLVFQITGGEHNRLHNGALMRAKHRRKVRV